MTQRNDDPTETNYCIVCKELETLPFKDYTLANHGYCRDCMRHVVTAEYQLNRAGLVDPPPGLVYHGDHRLF